MIRYERDHDIYWMEGGVFVICAVYSAGGVDLKSLPD